MARKVVEGLRRERKEEIVSACEKLYETTDFADVTIKLISEKTSFSRASVYNYFQTKEEIFLALLAREYERWTADLLSADKSDKSLQGFARLLAGSLQRRETLLKLLSMNRNEMEENSSIDRLVEFKCVFGKTIGTLKNLIGEYFPDSEGKQDEYVFILFSFMFGIYPSTHVTKKQIAAFEKVGVKPVIQDAYEITYNFVMKFFG